MPVAVASSPNLRASDIVIVPIRSCADQASPGVKLSMSRSAKIVASRLAWGRATACIRRRCEVAIQVSRLRQDANEHPDFHTHCPLLRPCMQLKFRPNTSDRTVIGQVFAQGQYDRRQLPCWEKIEQRYRRLIPAGQRPLIIDADANIGAATVWFFAMFPEAPPSPSSRRRQMSHSSVGTPRAPQS
jgi:hypothetical protein